LRPFVSIYAEHLKRKFHQKKREKNNVVQLKELKNRRTEKNVEQTQVRNVGEKGSKRCKN